MSQKQSPLLHNFKRGSNTQLWAVTQHRGLIHTTLAPLYRSQDAALRRAQTELHFSQDSNSFSVDNVSVGYHVATYSWDAQNRCEVFTHNPAAFEDEETK